MDLLTLGVSVIAFLIVSAIFFVFSFGFSKKGILILLSAAFFLALFGLLANSVFSIWKSILITFLLVLCVSYLMKKRFTFLFAEGDNRSEPLFDWKEQADFIDEPEKPSAPKTQPVVLENKNKDVIQPVIAALEPIKEAPQLQPEKAAPVQDWEELENLGFEAEAVNPEHELVETGTEPLGTSNGEDETNFLEKRLSLLEDKVQAVTPEKEANEEHLHIEDWIMEIEESPDTAHLDAHTANEQETAIPDGWLEEAALGEIQEETTDKQPKGIV